MSMMLPSAALAAARRPWPRWLRSLVLCALGYLAAEYALQQMTFSHDEARRRAIVTLQEVCHRECAAHGLRPEDLEGPFEAPVNFMPGSRHFEFLWRAHGVGGLVVMVNDNRLFIDIDHWWERQEWWYRDGAPPAGGDTWPHG